MKSLIIRMIEMELRWIRFVRWFIIEVELPLLRHQEEVSNKVKDYLNGEIENDY